MQMTNINPTMPIHIGDDTAIGGHSLLFTHSSWLSVLDGAPAKFEPITIGQRVWIPWRTFITSGVSIGDDVIIGPDSLINRNIPARSMAHGNPMKIVPNIFLRKPSPEKRTEILSNIINEFIAYLKHNKITAVLDKSLLQISGNGKQSQIQFCLNLETPLSGKVDLRVDDAAPEYLEERVLGSNCYINLNSRQRIGTSPAAEEFIRFLSRYGIRFHRLDE
jgi:hypothetical protein